MNDRTVHQLLDAWLERGPTAAPDRVAEAARLEVRSTRQAAIPLWSPRSIPTVNIFARVLAAASLVAGAVLGLNFLGGSQVGEPGPAAPTADPSASSLRSCGDVVVSSFLESSTDDTRLDEQRLASPYVATMGLRNIVGEQFARIVVAPAEAWGYRRIEGSLSGPLGVAPKVNEDDGDDFDRGGTEFGVGTPGLWNLRLTAFDGAAFASPPECEVHVRVLVVADEVLRRSDRERGLSEPPEPAGDAHLTPAPSGE